MSNVNDDEGNEDFLEACAERGISEPWAVWLSENLCSRDSFLDALQFLPAGNVDVLIKYVELLYSFSAYTATSQHDEFSLQRPISKVNWTPLVELFQNIAAKSSDLRGLVNEISLPAGELLQLSEKIQDSKGDLLAEGLSILRNSLGTLRDIELTSRNWQAWLEVQKGRSVHLPDTPMRTFDRQLANIWLQFKQPVSTHSDSPFAAFVESTFQAVGRKWQGITDSLRAAKYEDERVKAGHDIWSDLRKREQLRRRKSYDVFYRLRTRPPGSG